MDFKEYNKIRERIEKYEEIQKNINTLTHFREVVQPYKSNPRVFSISGNRETKEVPILIRDELTSVILAFLDEKIKSYKKLLEEI